MRQVNVAAVCDAYGNIDHFRATASENDSAARKKLREIERDGGRGRERERENREGEQRGNEREVSFVRDENEKEADFSSVSAVFSVSLSRARVRALRR